MLIEEYREQVYQNYLRVLVDEKCKSVFALSWPTVNILWDRLLTFAKYTLRIPVKCGDHIEPDHFWDFVDLAHFLTCPKCHKFMYQVVQTYNNHEQKIGLEEEPIIMSTLKELRGHPHFWPYGGHNTENASYNRLHEIISDMKHNYTVQEPEDDQPQYTYFSLPPFMETEEWIELLP